MSFLEVENLNWAESEKEASSSGRIPADAEFFQDHFPDYPVLPGVLALEILKRTAEMALNRLHASHEKSFSLQRIQSVKFSHFLRPGDAWESRLKLVAEDSSHSSWQARLLHQGKVAVSAEMRLCPEKSILKSNVN